MAGKRRGLLALVVGLVTVAGFLGVGVSSAFAFVDPINNPTSWVTGIPGTDGPSISTYHGQTPDPYTVDDFGPDTTDLITATEEVPLPWWGGLNTVALGVGAGILGWEIGTTANHLWFHMGTDPIPSGLTAGTWSHQTSGLHGGPPGWYFVGTSSHGTNNNGCPSGMSGCSNAGGSVDFYVAVISPGSGLPGAVYSYSAGCGSTTCYMRYMPSLPLIPDGTTAPSGVTTTVQTGWANHSTGTGVTTTADPWNTSHTPQLWCLQGGSAILCSAASPTGGLVTPLLGWPVPWRTDVTDPYGLPKSDQPNINELRCTLDPTNYACPTANTSVTPHIWANNGGPVTAYTMPNCVGLDVVTCEGLIGAAATGAHQTPPAFTEINLGTLGAVLTYAAGAVVTQSVGAGVSVSPATTSTITITYNPTPLPVVIPLAAPWVVTTDYCAEVTALGLTCTVILLTTPDPLAGPGELTHVTPAPGARIAAGGTVTVVSNPLLDPLGDPVPWPPGDPNDPGAPTPAPSPLPVPGGTGDGCNCPPFNFTPITGLSFGSRFPFGAFAYVTAILGVFFVTPQAPSFDLPITPTGGGHASSAFGTRHFTGDLSFLDSYMAIVRTLMSFALWIGGVYFIGARLVGFKAAGDLSEAADDGSVL